MTLSESPQYTESGEVLLFVPCLIDQVYPEVARAAAGLLKHLGLKVRYAPQAVCCGQPAFNAGEVVEAKKVATAFVGNMPSSGLVVGLSGSCIAMVRNFYGELFKNAALEREARDLSLRVMELSEFLSQGEHSQKLKGRYEGKVSVHLSCHTARELRSKALFGIVESIAGTEVVNRTEEPVCCGFGGLFCMKFPAVAAGMAKTRLEKLLEGSPDRIVSNDPGCIMHLRNEAKSLGIKVPILHLAEFLIESGVADV